MLTLPQITPGVQLRDAACIYASAGIAIFPLRAFGKKPEPGTHGLLEATTDLTTIERWWEESSDANIGINCGRSHLWVIDVDPRNGGELTIARHVAQAGPLPPALMVVRTPGGGLHYYYHVEKVPRRSKLGPGVDLQGDGAYVIAPPSRTLQGDYTVVAHYLDRKQTTA